MVAQVEMTYADEFLRPGERFLATPVDAGYLIKCHRACDAQDAPDQTPLAVYVAEAPAPALEAVYVFEAPAEEAEAVAEVTEEVVEEVVAPRRRGRPCTVKE